MEKTYIAPNATVVGEVHLGENVNIWYGAVLRGDSGPITVGRGTNIQDNVVIHDETRIGEYCTLGHGAIVHGCTIGDHCLIGMGAIVLTGARMGDGCLVGAGALVTGKTDAPAGAMLLGSPARVVRILTHQELAHQREQAEAYIRLAEKSLPGGD